MIQLKRKNIDILTFELDILPEKSNNICVIRWVDFGK